TTWRSQPAARATAPLSGASTACSYCSVRSIRFPCGLKARAASRQDYRVANEKIDLSPSLVWFATWQWPFGYILYALLLAVQDVVASSSYQPGTHGDEVSTRQCRRDRHAGCENRGQAGCTPSHALMQVCRARYATAPETQSAGIATKQVGSICDNGAVDDPGIRLFSLVHPLAICRPDSGRLFSVGCANAE